MSTARHSIGNGPAGEDRPTAIILAAGKGTRMASDLPKVLHPVGGRPMVQAVVDACRGAGCGRIVVVVGYGRDLVRGVLAGQGDLVFAEQLEQLGTGHAVQCARGAMGEGAGRAGHAVFVLAGDGPLIRAATLRTLLERHRSRGAHATLATAVIDDPTGYGRIVRDPATGSFRAIVEHRNATEEQRLIREVNPSYYCFEAPALYEALAALRPNAVGGEYYLTDVLEDLLARGRRVEVIEAVPPEDVLSINTPEQLAQVDAVFRARQAGAGVGAGAQGGAGR